MTSSARAVVRGDRGNEPRRSKLATPQPDTMPATGGDSACLEGMDATLDLRNTKARLVRVAAAAATGAVLTYFTMRAIDSSGPSANHDPVGSSAVPLLAIAIFVVTTMMSHAIITKRRR
jgi:hypothetical protein